MYLSITVLYESKNERNKYLPTYFNFIIADNTIVINSLPHWNIGIIST